ncbi:MAG: YebC/PmpR family DNA-binding transcriptional regulator [Chloroflexales bacterium]|nr:YebC/PmpR family DNA-binding transcriptional regulator [Chloroflexales bacterium]
MSGHSKWHSIRRSKGVTDQRRGQLFTKLARDVTVAVREGGADPEMNFRLRLAVDKARASNMPSDSIQRALDRGLGKGNEAAIEELYYEGYGPGGVALMIEAATDNRNRTVSEVRSSFTKLGGTLGESGSVGWMFELKGLLTIDLTAKKLDPDEVMLMAIDAGADDVQVSEDLLEVYTELQQLTTVRQQMVAAGMPIVGAEKVMKPKALVQLDEKEGMQALRLMERLEDLDDVQKVFTNLDVTDELAEKFGDA